MHDPAMLSNQQFERARRLALQLAGIELLERHRELLQQRSRRLGVCDCAEWDALLGAVEHGDTVSKQKLFRLLTTKFTGFFRQPAHFDVAAQHTLRVISERGRARLWSAAAATGEEPYSLAMALIEILRREDPPVSILATDVDAEALVVAKRGEYNEAAIRALGTARGEKFLRETGANHLWSIVPSVRCLIEFRELNLANAVWPTEGPFDVILCRNVIMYLEACHRYAVLERMASLLAPEGLLILDPAEHLGKASHMFTPQGNAVFSRRNTSPHLDNRGNRALERG